MNDDTDLMAMWEGVDIVVLTETWLTKDRAHWLRVPGFRFHFSHARQLSSRGARSGGVAVGVKSCLANLVKVEHIDAFPYMVWLNVHKSLIMGAMRDVLVLGCYLPPEGSPAYTVHSDQPLVKLTEMLSVRLGGRHLAIIGDMNARVGTSSEIPNMSWQDEMSSVDMLPRRSNQDRGLVLMRLAATFYCCVPHVI